MFTVPTHEEIGTRTFLDGRKVRKRFGDEVKIIDGDGLLLKTYTPLGCFFGAKWDENSRKFLPYLRDFFNKMKEKGNNFDLIYVSSDNSVEEMEEFMKEFPEDVLALYGPYLENDEESQLCWYLRQRYGTAKIPKLFVEFGIHPVYAPPEDHRLAEYGIYPGHFPFALSDIMEFGEEAWDFWMSANKQHQLTVDLDEFYEKSFFYGDDYQFDKHCLRTQYYQITRHPVWKPTETAINMFADLTLVRKSGEDFVNETAEEALENINIIGLYFSAKESEVCHTPICELKKCYDKWKADGESFEVIYLSKDNSEEDMKECMKSLHGDWLAVPFEEDWNRRLGGNVYFEDHLPVLVIMNKEGELIADKGARDVICTKENAINSWKLNQPATT